MDKLADDSFLSLEIDWFGYIFFVFGMNLDSCVSALIKLIFQKVSRIISHIRVLFLFTLPEFTYTRPDIRLRLRKTSGRVDSRFRVRMGFRLSVDTSGEA